MCGYYMVDTVDQSCYMLDTLEGVEVIVSIYFKLNGYCN